MILTFQKSYNIPTPTSENYQPSKQKMSTNTSESPSGSQDLPNTETSLNNMPNEIFLNLFECFALRDIVRCRQVCTRWRDIIDTILHKDKNWEQFCKHDFPKIYEGAMWKTPDITSWFEMYRTLSLWSSLDKAPVTINVFCDSKTINENIKSVTVQKKGQIQVQKKCSIMYYDLLSLRIAERKGITRQLASFVELEDVVVTLTIHGDLHISNKLHQNWHSDLLMSDQGEMVFPDVISFLVENRTVVFITLDYLMFTFNLDNKIPTHLRLERHIESMRQPDFIIVGFKNGCLYILTMNKELYSYDKRGINLKYKLDTLSNVMNCLYQHNMLNNLDWRFYYMMLTSLQQKRPPSHKFITKMHVYGDDLFFVGTQSGVLHIFYKPFYYGQLNLMKFNPVKTHKFSPGFNLDVITMFPIINIQVVEIKEGHIVLVCLPNTIMVITYSNDYKITDSTAIIPQ